MLDTLNKRSWYWWTTIVIMMHYFLVCGKSFCVHQKKDNIRNPSVNLWQETIDNNKSSCNMLPDTWESFSANIRLFTGVARVYYSHMPSYKWRWCLWLLIYAYGRLYHLLHLFNGRYTCCYEYTIFSFPKTNSLIYIKHLVRIITETLTKLSKTNSPIDFSQKWATRKKVIMLVLTTTKNIIADSKLIEKTCLLIIMSLSKKSVAILQFHFWKSVLLKLRKLLLQVIFQ